MHPDFGTGSTTFSNGKTALYGIPFTVVDSVTGGQAMNPINFIAYPDESDPGVKLTSCLLPQRNDVLICA